MRIEIGLRVFLRPTGNIARYNQDIQEGIIEKVARKYFYVKFLERNKIERFEISTLKNINDDCNSVWVLYSSKQEILDENEKNELLFKFKKLFDWTGKGEKLALDQLREMAKIAKLE